MRNTNALLLVIALVGAGVACNAPDRAEPTPHPPSATPEPSIQDQPSATPSAEPTPESTDTPEASTPLRIAYTFEGNVWALERGSAPSQLTDLGGAVDVRIADDGELIVYVLRDPDTDTAELRSVHFDGSDDRLLLDPVAFDALYPLDGALHYSLSQLEIIPGSHLVLFNTRAVFEGPGLAKNNDLLSIDADTGVLTTLLDRGDGGDFVLSPDEKQLAIVRPDSIGFVNVDGTDLRAERLTFPWVITYSEYFYYPFPVWTDASVLVAIPSEDPFFAPLTGTIWSIPADGSAPSLLATLNGNFFGPQRAVSSVSPDGSLLAYYDTDTSSGSSWLVVQALGDEVGTVYGIDVQDWFGWAPDSDYFVYSTGPELYLGQLDAEPILIGPGSRLWWISPTEYLYLHGTRGNWTMTLSAVGGESVALVELTADFVSYDFAR
jgi:hypothetical protein